MDDLARAGQIRPSGQTLPAGFWAREKPADPQGAPLAALLEERESWR